MLSDSLKSETRNLHTAVENSAFVQALFRGGLKQSAYALFLRNLREIYAALERGLERQSPGSPASLVWSPALRRLPAIDRDLDALHGPNWAEVLDTLPATVRYVERLDRLSESRPELLVAHAYVRYLGDLNGGQALARLVMRRFEPADGQGVEFYDFGEADVIGKLKQGFKVGLDEIGRTMHDDASIVDEAQLAFRLHAELFDELAIACQVVMRPVVEPIDMPTTGA